jgi:K+-sensing histidine kinase KdpD
MQSSPAPLRDAFFRRVEHDLRGELATMLAGVHFVVRYVPSLGDDGRRMLARVQGAGERLTRLLDELGHAAWAAGGDRRWLAEGPCDLGDLVTTAVAALERRAAEHEVSVETVVPHEAAIPGDADLLRVAIGYVVEAAILRSRGGRVRVAARVGEGCAIVTATDEAGALPAEALGRLLEPFAQRELSPQEPGRPRETLGLGLPIARGILVAHGGGLRAELSDDGRGVTLVAELAGSTP